MLSLIFWSLLVLVSLKYVVLLLREPGTARDWGEAGRRLLIDMSGTAGLKLPPLTSFLFASFDYTFRMQKDGYITPDLQFDHSLMARATISLF